MNSLLSGPIPGQSLTDTPGNYPWERPSEFTDPEEACEFLFDSMMVPSKAVKVLGLLDAGVSAESLARTILLAGFAEGKWTVDLALIIAQPVMHMLVGLGKRAGIDVQITAKRKEDTSMDDIQSIKNALNKAKDKPTPDAEEAVEDMQEDKAKFIPKRGLMAPKEM